MIAKKGMTKLPFKKLYLYLGFVFLIGLFLRVLFVQDMEYKEDEEYNFKQTQLIDKALPWHGMPSGVYLINPGMSIWVFTALAKFFKIQQPTSLATAVQLFAMLGMCLIIPFALKIVEKEEQHDWLWAFAFAMVNPFLVIYQRKLWPQPFLPFFTLITLIGWWTRHQRRGAWIWGMVGACLGQIHMSGFFFSAALFLWTLFFDPKRLSKTYPTNWRFWIGGSLVGALPLLPWVIYILQHPIKESMVSGWSEIIQLKYWAFWFTDPLGLHIGNSLGLLRGESNFSQISDFIRYPIIQSQPSYLVGIAHFSAFFSSIWIFIRGIQWVKNKISSHSIVPFLVGSHSNTTFVQNSILLGCGILMTITGMCIRRHYMAVTFPLELICLVRMAQPHSALGKKLLAVLWTSELIISAGFVGYIHVNHGSILGDYGTAYHTRQKK